MNHIIEQFSGIGEVVEIRDFGSGHINDSYLVSTKSAEESDYFLQRINHQVFKDIEGLTNNVVCVINHLKKRLEKRENDNMVVPQLMKTHNGRYFFKDDNGDYWRLFEFIPNSVFYDTPDFEDLAFEGGKIIGKFQWLLSDLEAKKLTETLQNFHDVAFRLENLKSAIDNDVSDRVAEVEEDIRFAINRAHEMLDFNDLVTQGVIPLRITHNDTKFNNILFTPNDLAISLVDLDTVMPGVIHYDFGDAIRTLCNTAKEDESDFSKVKFDLTLFATFTRGYLIYAHRFLTDKELEHLPFSGKLLAFIMGIRFLTDYLNGDTYYKIKHPTHNIDRARNQFKLVWEMEQHEDEIQETFLNALKG